MEGPAALQRAGPAFVLPRNPILLSLGKMAEQLAFPWPHSQAAVPPIFRFCAGRQCASSKPVTATSTSFLPVNKVSSAPS